MPPVLFQDALRLGRVSQSPHPGGTPGWIGVPAQGARQDSGDWLLWDDPRAHGAGLGTSQCLWPRGRGNDPRAAPWRGRGVSGSAPTPRQSTWCRRGVLSECCCPSTFGCHHNGCLPGISRVEARHAATRPAVHREWSARGGSCARLSTWAVSKRQCGGRVATGPGRVGCVAAGLEECHRVSHQRQTQEPGWKRGCRTA